MLWCAALASIAESFISGGDERTPGRDFPAIKRVMMMAGAIPCHDKLVNQMMPIDQYLHQRVLCQCRTGVHMQEGERCR